MVARLPPSVAAIVQADSRVVCILCASAVFALSSAFGRPMCCPRARRASLAADRRRSPLLRRQSWVACLPGHHHHLGKLQSRLEVIGHHVVQHTEVCVDLGVELIHLLGVLTIPHHHGIGEGAERQLQDAPRTQIVDLVQSLDGDHAMCEKTWTAARYSAARSCCRSWLDRPSR